MGQPQEKPIDQVLRLVDQLSPEEKELLLDQLKMDKLKTAIQIGKEQAARGELIDGEVVLAELRQRAEDRLRKSQL